MRHSRTAIPAPRAVWGLAVALTLTACATRGPVVASGPLPDAAETTAEELLRDLYAFADDSMRGRESGTIDEHRAAAFLADRLKALGLEPAGDSGFFQRVPLSRTARGPQTSVVVTRPDGTTRTLAVGPEVAPASSLGPGSPPSKRFADAELVFAQYGITGDDGSGSVSGLVIARAAEHGSRAKRSSQFAWHSVEEKGLLGSAYSTAHPTVPTDSIVAQLNAVKRGRDDEHSLGIVGPVAAPKGQSVVLGQVADSVKAAISRPLTIDRSFDNPTHPERIHFRNDQYQYAKLGAPILCFTPGLHADYHQVTDSPEQMMKAAYRTMVRRPCRVGWHSGTMTANHRSGRNSCTASWVR